MKVLNPWITYRTRFLVKAKQLNTSLAFTDVLGRIHSGRKGDYLVESCDGVLRIAPRQIFEDIYVPLLSGATVSDSTPGSMLSRTGENSTAMESCLNDSVECRDTDAAAPQTASRSSKTTRAPKEQELFNPVLMPCLSRKSPQPERRRRNPIPGARFL
jgi:hypothetical protein